jgi:hypothetical protein
MQPREYNTSPPRTVILTWHTNLNKYILGIIEERENRTLQAPHIYLILHSEGVTNNLPFNRTHPWYCYLLGEHGFNSLTANTFKFSFHLLSGLYPGAWVQTCRKNTVGNITSLISIAENKTDLRFAPELWGKTNAKQPLFIVGVHNITQLQKGSAISLCSRFSPIPTASVKVGCQCKKEVRSSILYWNTPNRKILLCPRPELFDGMGTASKQMVDSLIERRVWRGKSEFKDAR